MNKMRNHFPEVISRIKSSHDQVELMNGVLRDQWKALLFGFGLGILVPVFLIVGFLELLSWWIVGLGFLVLTGLLITAMRVLESSVVEAKAQDRKYFLACIRAATNMEELHYAGLFGYPPGGTGEERDQSYVEIQKKLASALAMEVSDDFH